MKTILKYFLIFVFAVSTNACASGPVGGLLFAYTQYPGQINTANDVKPETTAEGCIHNIFGIVSFGDAGAGSVANSNGIKKIAIIDYSALHILAILYRNHCVIVAGEKR
ncbi:TRL-like family protein [Leptospira gomenensis]|uniref:TRL-like family protein n=1 Tax=Leptospira gomenensis TaxID=2484974 RepID=A0A5F1YGJ2_9LEPT|nr:TRL domain-containing protein [Leptospira gomenensis]TGK31513.1 TRL-like family protein [Leptospira gomenensis]TGK44163.1 TRL-like family protein [Leptospira gomenensis]TGK46218.1 TRL-like family protein [Leptospira gomenensis]TGK54743.1 TRL-like family protein [Leptospira gomenensis]